MADYHSLLAKLVDGLPDKSPDKRDSVYDRARRALGEQLRTVVPSLTPAEIDREEESLDDAIRQVEASFAYPPPSAATPAARPRRPPAPIPPPDDTGEEEGREPLPPKGAWAGVTGRPVVLLAVLTLVAVPIGAVAWLWRDQPRPTAAAEPPRVVDSTRMADAPRQAEPAPQLDAARQAEPARQPDAAAGDKFGERVSGTGRSPAAEPTARGPVAPASPPQQPSAAPSASQEVSVAQRALMFEENAADPQTPTITGGRAVWRLDALNGGQGQPLETVIRGSVEYPGAGLSLFITVRRNVDAALPASHTIELSFTNVSVRGAPPRIVRDVALPMMRPEESIRGLSVAGLPVPVRENLFLIGLSDLKADVDRNTELLLRRNWMELPIRFASGQKAGLLFDKGVSGERVFNDAFKQWEQAPP